MYRELYVAGVFVVNEGIEPGNRQKLCLDVRETAMEKALILEKIRDSKIVAIIRENDPEVAFNAAMACVEGGITCVEIALTTPNGLDVVKRLAKVTGITVGAGTVLDAESARSAIDMGASFLLSPSVVPEMIRACSRHGVVSVPGAFSPTEVLTALETGADIVKVFPASTGGPEHIESIAAPFPQAAFMPSGGVSVENLERWFVRGVIAVGIGGRLTSGTSTGDFTSVTARARQLTAAAQKLGTE